MRRQHDKQRPYRHPEAHRGIEKRESRSQARNDGAKAQPLDLDAVAHQYGYDQMSKAELRALYEKGEDMRYARLLSLDDDMLQEHLDALHIGMSPAAYKAQWRYEYDVILYNREMYKRMWVNGVGPMDASTLTKDECQKLYRDYEARRATWKPLYFPRRKDYGLE